MAGGLARRFKRINWRGGAAVLAFLALWELSVRFKVPGLGVLPSLWDASVTFWTQYAGRPDYWASWVASFRRVAIGFVAAQLLGIPIGLLLGLNARLHQLVFPVFELLRPIPPLAWVPLSILFWPTQELSILFITFIGAFFIIIVNVHAGVRSIKQEHLWLAASMGASRGQVFRRITVPAVMPHIGVGMTIGMAVTWNVVIAAEMIASDRGLGRLTWEGYVSHTAPVVVIGMVSIGLAGYLSSLLIDHAERKLTPWRR